MIMLSVVLRVLAAISFLLAVAAQDRIRINMQSLGLFLLTLSMLVV